MIVRSLSDDARPCQTLVEEGFPPAAMISDYAFYATGGDDAVVQRHMAAMMENGKLCLANILINRDECKQRDCYPREPKQGGHAERFLNFSQICWLMGR